MIRCSECKHCGVMIIENPWFNRSFYTCGIAPKDVYWDKIPKLCACAGRDESKAALAAEREQSKEGGVAEMMRVWIVFWVAVFLLLDALDKLADCVENTFDRLVSNNWFVAALTVVNVWLVCKLAGWL